jgi:hypothetical protein
VRRFGRFVNGAPGPSSDRGGCHEFQQDAVRIGKVDGTAGQVVGGPPKYRPLDDLDAVALQQRHGAVDVAVPAKADVGRPRGWPLSHQREAIARLVPAQHGVAHRDLADDLPAVRHPLGERPGAQQVAVPAARGVQVRDGDRYMIDRHHRLLPVKWWGTRHAP